MPPCSLFIVVRSYSQLILRFGGPRSVLPKMYNFYARLFEYKCVDLVVLLNFEDINLFGNFQTVDNVLVHSGVCFNHS